MSQKAYNGLSLLEISKAAIEFFIKKRQSENYKSDMYFLYTTGNSEPLSDSTHELPHFYNQLKNIKAQVFSDTAQTLYHIYDKIGTFRLMNGCDNILGGRDIYKIDPHAIFFFTDNSDIFSIDYIIRLIHQSIPECDRPQMLYDESHLKNLQLKYRWDQQFFIFKICPQNKLEKGIIDQNTAQNSNFRHINNHQYHNIATYLNGNLYTIETYEKLLSILDNFARTIKSILSVVLENRAFQMNEENKYVFIDANQPMQNQQYNKLIDSKLDQSLIVNPQPNMFFQNSNQFQLKVIQNIYLEKDEQIKEKSQKHLQIFQSMKYKAEENLTQYSKINLPEEPMTISEENILKMGKQKNYPKFYVDFSKEIIIRIPQDLPLERLELDYGDLNEIFEQQYNNLYKDKTYFPVFSEDNVIFGVLRVYKKENQKVILEIFVYMWNFLKLSFLFEGLKMLKSQNQQASQSNIEQELVTYIESLPYCYWPNMKKILMDKNQTVLANNRQYRFQKQTDQERFKLQQFHKNYVNQLIQQKKKLEQDQINIRQLHIKRQAKCCMIETEDYHIYFQENKSIKNQKSEQNDVLVQSVMNRKVKIFQDSLMLELKSPHNTQKNAQNILNLKKHQFLNSNLQNLPVHKMAESFSKLQINQNQKKDPYVDDGDVCYVYEPEVMCGNPYRIVKRQKNKQFQQISSFSEDSVMVEVVKEKSHSMAPRSRSAKKLGLLKPLSERKIEESAKINILDELTKDFEYQNLVKQQQNNKKDSSQINKSQQQQSESFSEDQDTNISNNSSNNNNFEKGMEIENIPQIQSVQNYKQDDQVSISSMEQLLLASPEKITNNDNFNSMQIEKDKEDLEQIEEHAYNRLENLDFSGDSDASEDNKYLNEEQNKVQDSVYQNKVHNPILQGEKTYFSVKEMVYFPDSKVDFKQQSKQLFKEILPMLNQPKDVYKPYFKKKLNEIQDPALQALFKEKVQAVQKLILAGQKEKPSKK